MLRSLTSWVWLVEFKHATRALDASAEQDGDVAASLSSHFDAVDILRSDAAAADAIRRTDEHNGRPSHRMTVGSLQSTSWPAETFDCIAVHDAITRGNPSHERLLEDLTALHRLLRPDGWLGISAPNPPPRMRKPAAGAVPRRWLMDSLRRVGFRETRCYFVEPSNDRPLFLIPDSRPAILVYESSAAMRSETSLARRVASQGGLYSALYPAYRLIARA